MSIDQNANISLKTQMCNKSIQSFSNSFKDSLKGAPQSVEAVEVQLKPAWSTRAAASVPGLGLGLGKQSKAPRFYFCLVSKNEGGQATFSSGRQRPLQAGRQIEGGKEGAEIKAASNFPLTQTS